MWKSVTAAGQLATLLVSRRPPMHERSSRDAPLPQALRLAPVMRGSCALRRSEHTGSSKTFLLPADITGIDKLRK